MGVMLAEPGFHTRCFVEREQYPRECIIAAQRAGYFAPAPIWDDVATFDARPWRGHIDMLTAGYPCQPFSLAGQRKGRADERHLWPDVARIIDECAPDLVFLENVAGHVTLGLDAVLRDLVGMGYVHACGLFSTAETRGTQARQRVFILARRAGSRQERARTRSGCDRQGGECVPSAGREAVGDAGIAGHQRREQSASRRDGDGPRAYGPATQSGSARIYHSPPGPEDYDAWRHVLAGDLSCAPSLAPSDIWHAAGRFAQMAEAGRMGEAEAKSALCRVVNALASRSRALRLLGNGVDPMVAAHAYRTLGLALGLWPLDLERDRTAASGAV